MNNMTPWQSLAKSIHVVGDSSPDLFQKVVEANPAIYWYPGSGGDLTPLALDPPNNPTGRRLLLLRGTGAESSLILWMNDYADTYFDFPLGREGKRTEIVVGRNIRAVAEIQSGVASYEWNAPGRHRYPIPCRIFQVKVTGGAGLHQRPANGDDYIVIFSCFEMEQLFRQIFLPHSLKLEVVALVGQGNFGGVPQREDFNPYRDIPPLCAEHQEAVGQVRYFLADDDFNSHDYQKTQVQVEGWGHEQGVAMWQRTGAPVAAGDPVYVPILDILHGGTRDQRIALARCSRPLPDGILEALAQDEDVAVRYWLTRRDQDLPPNVLQTLARDEDVDVRYWLTQRDQDQPPQVLQTLAQDNSVYVRYRLAVSEQLLPHDVLQALARDGSVSVRRVANSRMNGPVP